LTKPGKTFCFAGIGPEGYFLPSGVTKKPAACIVSKYHSQRFQYPEGSKVISSGMTSGPDILFV
jgi:hypothetical protein